MDAIKPIRLEVSPQIHVSLFPFAYWKEEPAESPNSSYAPSAKLKPLEPNGQVTVTIYGADQEDGRKWSNATITKKYEIYVELNLGSDMRALLSQELTEKYVAGTLEHYFKTRVLDPIQVTGVTLFRLFNPDTTK